MRDFAIGDISGYKKEFEELIKKSSFDRIIALGDIIDRGPDSCGMIEFFIKNPQHICLMGNHEHMMIKTYEEVVLGKKSPYWFPIWIYVNGGKQTLESYGLTIADIPNPRAMLNFFPEERKAFMESKQVAKLKEEIKKLPKEHIDFLKTMPMYLETDSVFFSHASVKNWRLPKLFELQAFESNEHLLDIGCLWSRSNPDKPRPDNKLYVYGHQNKKQVLAHTKKHPQGEYVEELALVLPEKTWGVCIDTAKAGYLTGLNLGDLSLHYQVIDKK